MKPPVERQDFPNKECRLAIPRLAEESKPSPAQEVEKESPKESPGSLRVSRVKKTGDFWLAESPGDSFLTLSGGSVGTPWRHSRRLFFDTLGWGGF